MGMPGLGCGRWARQRVQTGVKMTHIVILETEMVKTVRCLLMGRSESGLEALAFDAFDESLG